MAPSRAAALSLVRLANSTPPPAAGLAIARLCTHRTPSPAGQRRHLALATARVSPLRPSSSSSSTQRRRQSSSTTSSPPDPTTTTTSSSSPVAPPPLSPPDYLNPQELAIFTTLQASLAPTALEVQDVSGGCGSMYAISVTSSRFVGLAVVRQHRLVNEVLGEWIKGWHGVQLRTGVPS